LRGFFGGRDGERWQEGGLEGLTRVATNPEVTAGVHAEVVVGEVALHSVLEAGDGGAVDDEFVCVEKMALSVKMFPVEDRCNITLTANSLRITLRGASVGQVTAQATLVEAQAVGLRVGRQAVQRRGDRTQADGHIPERTAGHTAGAIAGWDDEAGHVVRGDPGAVVGDVLSVAAHGGFAAVEERRADDVVGVLAPVDVGLVAFVAALGAQGVLVGPGEVAVP
jgi:hypothetical protein